jgi:hypothetical protein
MRSQIPLGLALGLALFCARNAAAEDYWDKAGYQDDTAATDNELVHGTAQQHDLETAFGPVADVDFYTVNCYGSSSYEAVIDSMSGDLLLANDSTNFQRLDWTGTTVLQSSEEVSVGAQFGGRARALRWEQLGPISGLNQTLRVQSANCGTNCGPEDQYRIRFYDTTIAVPRFNNANGQVTVLIIQNTTGWTRPIGGTISFWGTSGAPAPLDTANFSLTAKAALVLNTGTISGAAGVSGTITIAHDGGYGNLAVKSVALEPATGFSFDSPGLYKPH